MTDPRIVPDALEHRPHVHAQILREIGNLVREREPQGEEGVRCVLDQACLLGPHDQQGRTGHGKSVRHPCECVRVRVLAEGPDYQASGSADVPERAPLAHELRHDKETLERDSGPAPQARCRSDRQRAADSAHGTCRDGRYGLFEGMCDI